MGKGDKKTKKGKIIMGSYGVKRKRHIPQPVNAPVSKSKSAPAKKAEPAMPVVEDVVADTEAMEKEIKKAAAKKKTTAKAEKMDETEPTAEIAAEESEPTTEA